MQDAKAKPDSSPSPAIVPCSVGINYTIWEAHEDRIEDLREECPHVSIGGKQGKDSPRAVEHKKRDEWGCLWHFPGMGLDGVVIEHPLDTWDKLDTWQPPSPEEKIKALKETPEDQRPKSVSFEHGFLFLRLTYLRGFDNFMVDVAEDHPKLYDLRDIVADYWFGITRAHMECGATSISGGDDLGMQDRLPIRPEAWRKLLKPAYQRIFDLAHDRGGSVHLHTDGYIVDMIPDILEMGVTSLNPQDLVNGLDNLARLAKGKVRIALDIDRQSITVFGTPAELDAHIENCIRTLGSPEGGLSLIWGVYPGTPIESIEAVCWAMEKYHDLWAR